MKRSLVFLFCFLLAQRAWPCGNAMLPENRTKLSGRLTWNSDDLPAGYRLRESMTRAKLLALKMELDLRGGTSLAERNDYALALMHLGRAKEAVELLQRLEKEYPESYSVAANLGTAYELSGNNEEALRWIEESIHRNAHSHEGTEWLHVKILEAKIAQAKDPDYFKKHSVLELRPEKIGSGISIDGHKISTAEIRRALEYQLRERVQFVEPPDQPVASLLFDYAAIEAATTTLESAKSVLRFALEYGFPAEQINPLMARYDRRIAFAKAQKYGLFALPFFLVIVLPIIWFRCRHRKLRLKNLPKPELETLP